MEEGSGGEVGDVGQPVGDSFEDTETVVGPFEPAVGDPVGVVEGEDFVSPFEEGFDESVELDDGCFLPDFDERCERRVGLVWVGGEVDAVEVLEHPPGCYEFGTTVEDPA